MKSVFKLGGTLILNQFIADIACAMCILPFPMIFGKDSVTTYVLFLILDMFFFYYISYHSAYKVGFHDVSRHSSEQYDRGYLGRGLLAAIAGAAPSLLMLLVYLIGHIGNIVQIKSALYVFRMWNLYAYWPLSQLIPNHVVWICVICLLTQMVFPFIGYVCGCKGIVFSQIVKDKLSSLSKHK